LEYHRAQIRRSLGFRRFGEDAEGKLAGWLADAAVSRLSPQQEWSHGQPQSADPAPGCDRTGGTSAPARTPPDSKPRPRGRPGLRAEDRDRGPRLPGPARSRGRRHCRARDLGCPAAGLCRSCAGAARATSAGVPPVRGAGPILCYLDTPRRLPPPLGAGRLIQWAPAERSRDARHQGQGRRHRSAGAAA